MTKSMSTEVRFFKASPGAAIEWPSNHPQSNVAGPALVVVALELHNDPDALNHLGFDLYGAHGDGDLIDAWAIEQPVEVIDRDQLPAQLTWFPSPFPDPEA